MYHVSALPHYLLKTNPIKSPLILAAIVVVALAAVVVVVVVVTTIVGEGFLKASGSDVGTEHSYLNRIYVGR
jgi:hypothetical protein